MGRVPKTQLVDKPTTPSNYFVVLSSSEDILVLEEGEVQCLIEKDEEVEVNTKLREQSGTTNSELPSVGAILQEIHPSQNGANPSSSYVEILKKYLVVILGSFDDDSIEKISKKAGRKSKKDVG